MELLTLDEPTSGLDPLMEEVFQSCAAEARAAGRTILLSSHILSEVETLCDRVSIIRRGRTVETGSLAELRVALEALRGRPAGARARRAVAGRRTGQVAPTGRRTTVPDRLGVRSLTATPPILEELFLRHYARGDEAGELR